MKLDSVTLSSRSRTPSALSWIGSVNSEVAVTAAWHTAPHRSARDLFDRELIVGGSTGVDPETTPRLFNALLGTKFKIINGYPGTTEINEMAKTYNDAWAVAKAKGTAVSSAANPNGNTRNNRIDYVWYSKGATALSVVSASRCRSTPAAAGARSAATTASSFDSTRRLSTTKARPALPSTS